jgi:hypothetical protein
MRREKEKGNKGGGKREGFASSFSLSISAPLLAGIFYLSG